MSPVSGWPRAAARLVWRHGVPLLLAAVLPLAIMAAIAAGFEQQREARSVRTVYLREQMAAVDAELRRLKDAIRARQALQVHAELVAAYVASMHELAVRVNRLGELSDAVVLERYRWLPQGGRAAGVMSDPLELDTLGHAIAGSEALRVRLRVGQPAGDRAGFEVSWGGDAN